MRTGRRPSYETSSRRTLYPIYTQVSKELQGELQTAKSGEGLPTFARSSAGSAPKPRELLLQTDVYAASMSRYIRGGGKCRHLYVGCYAFVFVSSSTETK